MSIILGNGDALKDLPIGNKKISKVVVGNKVVWQKPSGEWPGLKFTSNEDGSTVGYIQRHGQVDKDIYTSTDGKNWTAWDGSNITLNNGESIYIWNKKNSLTPLSLYAVLVFTMSGSIAASGNVMSMINFGDFSNNYGLKNLFQYCTVLTTAPDLPAIILTNNCYNSMFQGCTSLTTAPELPATTLADQCYYNMFNGCTALTTAPELPATILTSYCYQNMFFNCNNLNSIKLLYTGNFDIYQFSLWVNNVSSTGTLYYNGSDTTRGSSAIPEGWTVEQF